MISPDDITIRNDLRPGDIGYIIHLHGKLYSEGYGYGLDFEAYVAKGFHDFYMNYSPGSDRVWICEYNGKIIGFLALMSHGEAAQLRYFIIDTEFRGLGLGHRLITLYLDFLKESGYASTYLLTSPDLEAAVHLYEKFGFSFVEELHPDAFAKPEILYKYELKVTS